MLCVCMLNCIHLYIYMHLSTIEIASKNLFELKSGSLSWDILVLTFEYIPPAYSSHCLSSSDLVSISQSLG